MPPAPITVTGTRRSPGSKMSSCRQKSAAGAGWSAAVAGEAPAPAVGAVAATCPALIESFPPFHGYLDVLLWVCWVLDALHEADLVLDLVHDSVVVGRVCRVQNRHRHVIHGHREWAEGVDPSEDFSLAVAHDREDPLASLDEVGDGGLVCGRPEDVHVGMGMPPELESSGVLPSLDHLEHEATHGVLIQIGVTTCGFLLEEHDIRDDEHPRSWHLDDA